MKRFLLLILTISILFLGGCESPTQETEIVTTSKSITAFVFTNPVCEGAIDEENLTIEVIVPYGTDLTSLAPTVIHNGASLEPKSGVEADFSSDLSYTVTAGDGETQEYTVSVTVDTAPATDKAITSFGFADPFVSGTVNESAHTVSVNVPYGTTVNGLAPIVSYSGVSLDPPSGDRNDFSDTATYTVYSEDGDSQAYEVTVTVEAYTDSDTAITSFSFTDLSVDGYIDYDSNEIWLTVPDDTDLTALTPNIVHGGVSVSPESGESQDFSGAVTYTVTATDGSKAIYTVNVLCAPAEPVISPDASIVYQESVTITITCATEGASIYYSWDGWNDPSEYDTLYTGPFTITNTLSEQLEDTIYAIAIKDDLESDDVSATFTIDPNEAPVASAGLNQRIDVGGTVTLDGSGSSDTEGGGSQLQLVPRFRSRRQRRGHKQFRFGYRESDN